MKIKKCIFIFFIILCLVGILKSVIRIFEDRRVIYMTESRKEEIGDMISGTSFDSAGVWKITYGTVWLDRTFRVYYIFDETIEKDVIYRKLR